MVETTTWQINLTTIPNGAEKYLSGIDYVLLFFTLFTSFAMGIYFGLSKNKARTTEDYFLGGKMISFVPISLSIIATTVSANTLLAVPADIYKFGSSYIWTFIGEFIGYALTLYIFLPIFFKLEVISIFQYLELRFDRNVRLFTSALSTISTFCYTPIVLYIPSLAFSKGIDVHIIAIIVVVVCTLYTTIGGFKAVIWTDAFQFFLMVGSIIVVLALGTNSIGGLWETISIAAHGDRWDIFDFSVDLTSRRSTWGPLIGNIFFSLSCYAVGQVTIQKFIALRKMEDVKRCVYIQFVGVVGIKVIALLIGNAVYAKYAKCDVFRTGKVEKTDELVPYFVLDVAGSIWGLPGLFFAGCFSATLSTLSSCLNGVSASIYKDFILPFISKDTSQKRSTNIIKLIVVLVGVLTFVLLLIVERVGGLFPFTTTLQSISAGPIVGIFVLGMLCPFANSKGTLAGAISSVLLSAWIGLGSTLYKVQGWLPNEEKPTSVENCESTTYSNYSARTTTEEHNVMFLYRISFWYHSAISTITVIIVGIVVSLVTKTHGASIDKNLLSPWVHSYLPKQSVEHCDYNVVPIGEDLDDQACSNKKENC